MRVRQDSDGQISPEGQNAEPAAGELIFGGGTAFASASNPSAEVVDGTGVTAGLSRVSTLTVASGTISAPRAGDYDVMLSLADFSCGAASGNVQFDVQYAPDGTTFAAFGTDADADGGAGRMQVIRAAATSKGGLTVKKRQRLTKGGKIRVIVTSAAGGAVTITEGSLSLTQVHDPVGGVSVSV